MGIFNNISRYDDEEEFDINYFLSLMSSQGIHFDQNKNLDMGNKRIMRLANPQDNTDSVNLQYLNQILNDYYKKTYLDSKFNQKSDKSQLQNYIQKNQNINMGNNFKITNLKEGTDPKDAVNKHQLNQVETNFLKLDGSNKMSGDLNLNGKKIVFPGQIDMNNKLILNLLTKADDDLSAVNMITLKNKLLLKADNSRVNLKADKLYVDHNFFEIGEDIDMRDKEIYNLQTKLDDLKQSPDLNAYYKDQSLVINKEYIHNRCLINDDKDSDFDLKQKLITNCDLTESLFNDSTLVPKKYVDNKIINIDTSNFIKKNSNDNKMESDLNMNNFNIQYIKNTSITGCRISNLAVSSTANISNLNVTNNATLQKLTLNKSQNLTDLDAVNKHYLDSRLKNFSPTGQSSGLLKTDGSNHMNADLNMNHHSLKNVKEISVETATISYLSVVRNTVLSQATVFKSQNLSDLDIINKHYLDSRLQNINISGLLKTDGSNHMNADLDLGNNKILKLKEPSDSEILAATNVSYVTKIKKSLKNDISSLHEKNIFLPFMLDLKYWNGDSKIRNLKLLDKNLGIHDINLRCLEFEIEHEVKPGTKGLLYQYKGNIKLKLDDLPSEKYALTLELSPKWNVNATNSILLTNLQNLKHESQTFETFIRQYLNFEKVTDKSFITFEIKFDLKHDIPLNFKNYWEKAYIIIYGIRDLSGDSTVFETIFDNPIYSYNNEIFFRQNINFNSEFTLNGLKIPIKANEAANKLFVEREIAKFSTYIRMNGFDYFTIFDSFIDFNSLFFIDFEWDSIFNKYLIKFMNYGLYTISRGIRHPSKDDIDNFSYNGFNLDLFYLNNENTSFNEFTFFLVFNHKKDKELLINFNSKDPNPLTPIAFSLRIDNSKIYFEPKHAILAPDLSSKPKRSILLPKSSSTPSGKIIITTQNNLSEYLNFDPSYIGKKLMLWFTYDLTFNQTINPASSLAKTIKVKGNITMKLNNDDLSLNYIINQTLRFRDDEYVNDLSKINKIDFINFDTTGYKFGFKNHVNPIISKERFQCLWNEIKNGLYIK